MCISFVLTSFFLLQDRERSLYKTTTLHDSTHTIHVWVSCFDGVLCNGRDPWDKIKDSKGSLSQNAKCHKIALQSNTLVQPKIPKLVLLMGLARIWAYPSSPAWTFYWWLLVLWPPWCPPLAASSPLRTSHRSLHQRLLNARSARADSLYAEREISGSLNSGFF